MVGESVTHSASVFQVVIKGLVAVDVDVNGESRLGVHVAEGNQEVRGQRSASHRAAVVGSTRDGVFGEGTRAYKFVVVVGVIQDGFPLQFGGCGKVVGRDANFHAAVQDLTCVHGSVVEAGVGGKLDVHQHVARQFVVESKFDRHAVLPKPHFDRSVDGAHRFPAQIGVARLRGEHDGVAGVRRALALVHVQGESAESVDVGVARSAP